MKIDIFSERTAKVLSWVGLSSMILGAIIFVVFGDWDFCWTISEEKVGQFGDFIGGVVGSLLAFVGVILYYVALTEQREDIKINREALETQVKALNQQIEEFRAQTTEMQETRTVYEEQTNLYRQQTNYYKQQVKELKTQTKLSSLQHFNSEFYSLLNVFINVRNKSLIPIKKVIGELSSNVKSNPNSLCDKHYSLVEEYTKQYYKNSNFLSVYFKTIYRLLRMIDDSNLEKDQKQGNAKTLRSQLSEIELLVLYYNYYSDFGEKVKFLVTKYNLLKYLNFMDKLEVDTKGFVMEKASVISYLNKLSLLFDSKIKQSQDLETEDNIIINEEMQFLAVSSKYYLEINDEWFIFSIELAKGQMSYAKEDYFNLFLLFLYEYFFLSKLKCPVDNIFEKIIIEHDDTFEFKYKSELKNII